MNQATTYHVNPQAGEKPSPLPKIGSVVTMVAFVYLAAALIRNSFPLNPASWILWTILDVYLAYNMFKSKNEGAWIMTGLAGGALLITTILMFQVGTGIARFAWGMSETLTVICFAIAFIIGRISLSEKVTVNMGTTAMFIAGIPTLIDAWNKPAALDPLFWGLCTAGCIIMFLGSKKGFTNRYLPVAGLIFNGFITALAMGLIK